MDDRDRLNPPRPPPPAPPGPIGPPGAVAEPAPLTGPPVEVRATWQWWEAVLLFLMVIGGQVIISIPLGEEFVLSDAGEWVAGLLFGLFLGGGTLLWLWIGHRPAFGALGIPKQPGRDLGAGLGWGVAIRLLSFPVIFLVAVLVDALSSREIPTPEQIESNLSGPVVVLAVFVVLVIAPAAEELFFRGFLFRALRSRRGFLPAALVSSLAFGLVHFQPEGLLASLPLMVGVAAAAVGFAWVYERRQSILAPIVAHMVFNVVGVIFILSGA